MKHSNHTDYDVIVIGGGHAGLAVSYFLCQHNINHIVFERGRIGETWRSQRWNSFTLNTPNAMSMLPGDSYDGDEPDGFFSLSEFVQTLELYASKFNLPVNQGANVIAVRKDETTNIFTVGVAKENTVKEYTCRQVVIASGSMNEKRVPSFARHISDHVTQFHTKDYKHPEQLPDGNVLVVGSAQSGCQIAEDLLEAGKKVFLSTSLVPRVPRRYRGKDIFEWLVLMKFVDMPVEHVPDPHVLKLTQPQVSGVGPKGHTVSLQYLKQHGATIVGRLSDAHQTMLHFQLNAAKHVQFADGFSQTIKKMIDEYIDNEHLDAPENGVDHADIPDNDAKCVTNIASLDTDKENIHSIIWTTGFTADFSWILLPVLDKENIPIHKHGISNVDGLYFIGFPWLRTRKSGIIYGIGDDAKFIVKNIRTALQH